MLSRKRCTSSAQWSSKYVLYYVCWISLVGCEVLGIKVNSSLVCVIIAQTSVFCFDISHVGIFRLGCAKKLDFFS